MITSIKQSPAAFALADVARSRPISSCSSNVSCALLPKPRPPALSSLKPLYLALPSQFRSGSLTLIKRRCNGDRDPIVVEAYKANRSEGFEIPEVGAQARSAKAAQKVKIRIYFATWWALNVVFNIYNKKVLNAFPFPWLMSTLSLACGSLMMLISWALRIAEAPKTDFDFWKALAPVAVAHTIGHVATTVSMSKVAVSFTHIIKSGEPAFSVLVSRFLLEETFPVPVYLSEVVPWLQSPNSTST